MANNHQPEIWRSKEPVVIRPTTRLTSPVSVVSKADSYIEIPAFNIELGDFQYETSPYYAAIFNYKAPFAFSFNELPIIENDQRFYIMIRYTENDITVSYLLSKPAILQIMPIYVPVYSGQKIKKNFSLIIIPTIASTFVTLINPLRFKIGIKQNVTEARIALSSSINIEEAGFTFTSPVTNPITLSPLLIEDTN